MDYNISKLSDRTPSYLLNTTEAELKFKKKPCLAVGLRQRFIIAVCCFVTMAVNFCNRTNLSVALVAMVNSTYVKNVNSHSDDNTTDITCESFMTNQTDLYVDGQFNWSQQTQGFIYSSFYYGYIVTQLFGGFIADKYGAKHVLGFATLLSSLIGLLQPSAANVNIYFFVTLRILLGITQGVIYPAVTSMISNWAPDTERSKMNIAPTAGITFGTVVAFLVSGVLCYKIDNGWPYAFYTFGIAGVLWYPVWLYCTSNTPREHSRITKRELEYIEESLIKSQSSTVKRSFKNKNVPWCSILTSMPFWAVLVGLSGMGFGYSAIISFLPTYMTEVLKFDIMTASAVSVIRYVTGMVACVIAGFLSDFLARVFNSVTTSRKIMTVCSHIICGGLLIGIPFACCDRALIISILAVSSFFGNFMLGGTTVNLIDIAPQFAGTIAGVCNTSTSFFMILGPFITGVLTNYTQTVESWGRAFFVMASVTMASGTFFLIFGSGKKQPWAKGQNDPLLDTNAKIDYSGLHTHVSV